MRRSMLHGMALAVLLILQAVGCVPVEKEAPIKKNPATTEKNTTAIKKALLADQKAIYPELYDGKYLFLADFEPHGPIRPGRQVSSFSLEPAGPNDGVGPNSRCELTSLLQRTGVAALKVTLDPRTALVYHFPHRSPGEFSGSDRKYTLLSMALLSGAMRDDLRVTLISSKGRWTSGPKLLRRGWNQVLIDIQRLGQRANFDAKDVQAIRLSFIKSADPVTFTLDDLVLIDNYARVVPVPKGFLLLRNGLDYTVKLSADGRTVGIRQCKDGLWRLGLGQPVVKLSPPAGDESFGGIGEQLSLLGPNRVGQVLVEEHNPVRVRISNTWLFPSRAGQWAMVGVRHLRWVYTIYPDGRWVTDIQLNNAGGRPMGRVSIFLADRAGVWSGPKGGVSKEYIVENFIGPAGRWSYLQTAEGRDAARLQLNYLKPARIEPILARKADFAPGDADCDGFDESQGCYFLAAANGHCRFRIIPPPGGLLSPVFRIAGPWRSQPSVNVEGLAVRNVSCLSDGSVIFALKGKVLRSTSVEIFGSAQQGCSDKKE